MDGWMMNGWMDGWMDEWIDEWMNKWMMDGWMEGKTDGQTKCNMYILVLWKLIRKSNTHKVDKTGHHQEKMWEYLPTNTALYKNTSKILRTQMCVCVCVSVSVSVCVCVHACVCIYSAQNSF